MEVYIEYVIFDNFVIDSIILFLSSITLNFKLSRMRLMLGASFGVVCAVCTPFISCSFVVLFLIKVAMGLVMTLLIRKYKSILEYIITFVVVVTYTFVLGGVCYALCLAFGGSALGVLVNAYQIPMGAIVLICAFYVYLLWKLILYLRHRGKNQSLYYDVIITLKNKKYYVRGYVDSGNNVYSGDRPVVVLSRSAFCKTFKDFPYDNLILCKTDKIPYSNAHFIDYYTANGTSKMLVFDIDKIELKNSERTLSRTDVSLGVSKTGTFSGSFDCLLNNDFL